MSIDITEHPAADPGRRLLEAEEVGRLLGVPAPYIYALARRGAIPVARLGERYVRFRAEAIEAWIQEQEEPARRRN